MGQQQPKALVPINQRIFHPKLLMPHQKLVIKDIKNNTKIIQYGLGVASKQSAKKWEAKLKQYFKNIDASFLYLPIRYYYKTVEVCGSAGVMDIFYEYYPETLFTEIMDRSDHCKPYSQEELWKILYSVSLGAYQLHRQEKKIGQFSLQLVFISKQLNQIKIGTGLSFFSDVVIDQIIAPEATIQTKSLNKNNVVLQQSFCIGVILLCAALLIPRPPIMSQLTTDYQRYLQLFDRLKKQNDYSLLLKQTIIRMCNINPSLRITPEMIVKNLSNYSDIYRFNKLTVNIVDGASTLIKKSDQQYQKIQQNSRVTFVNHQDPSNIQVKNFSQTQKVPTPSSYSKSVKNTLQKAQSQYLRLKKEQETEQTSINIMNIVDKQLQNFKKIFPSKPI